MRRLLLAAIALLAATGCLPTHPRPVAGPGWNTHTIARGQHGASVHRGSSAPAPLLGLTRAAGRTYHFVFDASARYTITNPVEPDDQLDWNKLPGLSDCGDVDLAENGFMFAWRWRTDLVPRVLEVNAYWNDDGEHHWLDEPLLTLTKAQVDAKKPIWFRLRISNDKRSYEFGLRFGTDVVENARVPRSCPNQRRDVRKWAGGFYFGGTSVAPQRIRGWMYEPL
jgi:hypothetical protein